MTMMDTYQLKRRDGIVCWNCSGLGECEGGGMMKSNCGVCGGEGWLSDLMKREPKPQVVKLDKRSKMYKESVKKLQNLGLSLSEAENRLKEAV